MPRYAPNKMPPAVKKRFFELIRAGVRGAVAAREVGVSVSCGSVWFVDAGRVHVIERPISPRYLSQDDRIEIADGLRRGESGAAIADRIAKSFQNVYRERALRPNPGGPARASPQRAAICAARRPGQGGHRQAPPPLVTGPDQSVAPPPLP